MVYGVSQKQAEGTKIPDVSAWDPDSDQEKIEHREKDSLNKRILLLSLKLRKSLAIKSCEWCKKWSRLPAGIS
jgi:hypothetical protein